jgi:cytochrome c oxidase subunit 2
MANNRRHFVIATILILISTVLVYWVLDSVLLKPMAAVVEAGPIDNLFDQHIWLIAFLFALVAVFMCYALIVFRARGDEGDGEHIHGSGTLEIIWTVVPCFVVVYFSWIATTMLIDLTRPNPEEYVVSAEGRQWSWLFTYPESGAVTPELVLQVDRPVRMHLTSDDVLHNFWVPEFRVKQDTVPGKVTYLRFTPNVLGEYVLRCAELCGTNHSGMLATVRVVPADEFRLWQSEQIAQLQE